MLNLATITPVGSNEGCYPHIGNDSPLDFHAKASFDQFAQLSQALAQQEYRRPGVQIQQLATFINGRFDCLNPYPLAQKWLLVIRFYSAFGVIIAARFYYQVKASPIVLRHLFKCAHSLLR